jgi:hypothetical protein
VAFAEWTDDEQLRQTTFLGCRDDEQPEEVVLGIAVVLATSPRKLASTRVRLNASSRTTTVKLQRSATRCLKKPNKPNPRSSPWEPDAGLWWKV